MEQADMSDSKPDALNQRAGSSPARGTNFRTATSMADYAPFKRWNEGPNPSRSTKFYEHTNKSNYGYRIYYRIRALDLGRVSRSSTLKFGPIFYGIGFWPFKPENSVRVTVGLPIYRLVV